MIVVNLGTKIILTSFNFGGDINPHLGILFISGLFFGPLGVAGATIGNVICDQFRGYSISITVLSAIVSFGVTYLGYKLWYNFNQKDNIITKPRLNNTHNMFTFLMIIIVCALLYSLLTSIIVKICYPNTIGFSTMIGVRYFINYMNFALIFSIIGIWTSRKRDFAYTPSPSDKPYRQEYYNAARILLSVLTPIILIAELVMTVPIVVNVIEVAVMLVLIYVYSTIPIKRVREVNYTSIPERIMDRFLQVALILMLVGVVGYLFGIDLDILELIMIISVNQDSLLMVLFLDVLVIIFFIPTIFIIRYIEYEVVNPLILFSKIESRLKKNELIKYDDLISLYSKYSSQEDEIGILSRSQIELIEYNNNYIENIKRVESEKQRIETELKIAHNIQVAILPEDEIDNEYYEIGGYCKPAKEVGGDFYDYYELDEDNLVIVIGDASGKGVPAALFTTITQNSIKQNFKYERDPSVILSDINSQMCEKNPECMFITLWLGIFNRKTHSLTYANAGHNPPIIRNGDEFTFLDVDSEIVLGIMDDYEFHKAETVVEKELVLYTDGVTDAQNSDGEAYSEERLISIVNEKSADAGLIDEVIDDIDRFCGNEEQFDDITLLVLRVKK